MGTITLINKTEDTTNISVAVYAKSFAMKTLETHAWVVPSIPPGGQTIVSVPVENTVYANFPSSTDDKSDPYAGQKTQVVTLTETTAHFLINTISGPNPNAGGAEITQVYTGLVVNEVRIENQYADGAWTHICKNGFDLLAPSVLPPGQVRIEDIRLQLHLAVVSNEVAQGSALVSEDIAITETPILENQTATLTGSQWNGYTITVS